MLDFEEYSSGHQDLRANKYYSAVNVCPSPTIMDMLLSAGDSLSFQEMLDIDIKSEIDDVLGSHNEFTSFSFSDLPPLDLDDSPSDLNMWFTTSNSNQSNSNNFNIDFIGSEAAAMMVNPNSVMPLALVTVPTKTISPALKPASTAQASQKALNFAPNAAAAALKDIKAGVIKKDPSAGGAHAHIERRPLGKTIKIQSAAQVNNKSLMEQKSVLNIKNAIQKQFNSANPGFTNVRVVTQRKQQFHHHAGANRLYSSSNSSEKAYPKPAYSYSCLIAMALKNSRTGSLPVSEIYNFMCDHFPYFKTAPNGWKNSVRHNLSLNKCFEKIEKPAVSGAQRKGCLWAMNPAKIGKMDEEVQKWSRKDPSAIRRAMINPDHLESLERGELKYNCRSDVEDSYGDSSADTEEEDGSDVEVEDRQEMEDIAFVNVNAPTDDDCGFDIEVADTIYETASGTGTIKIEMEVVDDELIPYDDSPSSKKRSRSILELEDDFTNSRIYQLHTQSRRKTAYYIKNE